MPKRKEHEMLTVINDDMLKPVHKSKQPSMRALVLFCRPVTACEHTALLDYRPTTGSWKPYTEDSLKHTKTNTCRVTHYANPMQLIELMWQSL